MKGFLIIFSHFTRHILLCLLWFARFYVMYISTYFFFLVLLHCWLGDRKGIQPVKNLCLQMLCSGDRESRVKRRAPPGFTWKAAFQMEDEHNVTFVFVAKRKFYVVNKSKYILAVMCRMSLYTAISVLHLCCFLLK